MNTSKKRIVILAAALTAGLVLSLTLSNLGDRAVNERAGRTTTAWWEPALHRNDRGSTPDSSDLTGGQPGHGVHDRIAEVFERGVHASQSPEQRRAVVDDLAACGSESAMAYDALLKLYALWSAKAETAPERRAILVVFSKLENRVDAQRLMLDAIALEDASGAGTSLVGFAGSSIARSWFEHPSASIDGIRLLEGASNPRVRHALMIATMSSRKPLGQIEDVALRDPMRRAYYESRDAVVRSNVLANIHRLGDPNLAFELSVDALGRFDSKDGGDAIASAAVSTLATISKDLGAPHREHSIELIVECGARPDIGVSTFVRCVDVIRRLAPDRLRELRQRMSVRDKAAHDHIDTVIKDLLRKN